MSVAFSHPSPAPAGTPASPLARPHSLRDGTVVRLRPLEPTDGDELRAGFARLSPQSRYLRFFSPLPRLPEPMLRRLLNVDGANHVAIVAETIPVYDGPPEPLGVARFVRLPDEPTAAEVGVAVADEMHGRGLETVLVTALVELARERGFAKLVFTVLAENHAMLRLLGRLAPAARVRREQGVLTHEIDLG